MVATFETPSANVRKSIAELRSDLENQAGLTTWTYNVPEMLSKARLPHRGTFDVQEQGLCNEVKEVISDLQKRANTALKIIFPETARTFYVVEGNHNSNAGITRFETRICEIKNAIIKATEGLLSRNNISVSTNHTIFGDGVDDLNYGYSGEPVRRTLIPRSVIWLAKSLRIISEDSATKYETARKEGLFKNGFFEKIGTRDDVGNFPPFTINIHFSQLNLSQSKVFVEKLEAIAKAMSGRPLHFPEDKFQ